MHQCRVHYTAPNGVLFFTPFVTNVTRPLRPCAEPPADESSVEQIQSQDIADVAKHLSCSAFTQGNRVLHELLIIFVCHHDQTIHCMVEHIKHMLAENLISHDEKTDVKQREEVPVFHVLLLTSK